MSRATMKDSNIQRERKLLTQKAVEERNFHFEDATTQEMYEVIQKWLCGTRYQLFGTITFRYGAKNRDILEGVARRLKRLLNKSIPSIRIVFIFEDHRLRLTTTSKWHIHFLIEPLPISLPAFKAKLNASCRKIKGVGLSGVGIGKTDIREIYDQTDLVDYLTKAIRHGNCTKLDLDYMNSDLRKYTEVVGEEHNDYEAR